MLDKNTFGNSACAINLVKILDEMNDKKLIEKVSSFLSHNNKIIKEMTKIENKSVKMNLARIYGESLHNQQINVPEKVYTHTVNLLIAKLRQYDLRH